MLQRIQTIYLLFVFLIQSAGFIFLPQRLVYSGVYVEVNQSYILLISNFLLIVIPFWNIFQFRNRKRQFVLNRFFADYIWNIIQSMYRLFQCG